MRMNFSRQFDLTHTLQSDTPTWDESCGFQLLKTLDYDECAGQDKFRVQKIGCRAGIGTHIDAPAHCFRGRLTVEELPLSSLIAPCVILKSDMSLSGDLVIGKAELSQYESKYGRIPVGAFVIASTGWSAYWGDPTRYRNNLRFPSVHPELALELLERGISGLGIDTLSADAGDSSFPVHRAILGAGKYLVENVATTSDLPEHGGTALIFPMKIGEGTEAPVRLVLGL